LVTLDSQFICITINALSLSKTIKMSETKIKFELEKQNKNSVRYKEIPKDGMPPILGSIYVQKWYAGNSKFIEVTVNKLDE